MSIFTSEVKKAQKLVLDAGIPCIAVQSARTWRDGVVSAGLASVAEFSTGYGFVARRREFLGEITVVVLDRRVKVEDITNLLLSSSAKA